MLELCCALLHMSHDAVNVNILPSIEMSIDFWQPAGVNMRAQVVVAARHGLICPVCGC